MALMNRIGRLFRADMHAVLDQIEEPEQLLRQAIRDMEEELQKSVAALKSRERDQAALGRTRAEIEARLDELEGELDLSFEAGNDKLAKAMVRRKLEAQQSLRQIESAYEAAAADLIAEQAEIETNRATLDGLREKAAVFAHSTSAVAEQRKRRDADCSVTDDDVEVQFLREQALRSAS